MSTTRDADRILRAWLEQMPSDAPDRAIDAVLKATAAAPQVRARPRVGRWRLNYVNRLSLIATVAVVILALAGVGFVVSSGLPRPTSSPSPSTRPSPTDQAGVLEGTWVRSDRPGLSLVISGRSARLLDAAGTVLLDETIAANSGVLSLSEVATATGECSAQPVVRYVYRVNPDRNGFFALPYDGRGSDTCAARAEAFTATWTLVTDSPAPTSVPRPTASVLEGAWARSDRPDTSLVVSGASARIVDPDGTIRFDETIDVWSGGLLLMEGSHATPACSAQPIIQYAFRVNSEVNVMLMLPSNGRASDLCPERADAFTATWALITPQ